MGNYDTHTQCVYSSYMYILTQKLKKKLQINIVTATWQRLECSFCACTIHTSRGCYNTNKLATSLSSHDRVLMFKHKQVDTAYVSHLIVSLWFLCWLLQHTIRNAQRMFKGCVSHWNKQKFNKNKLIKVSIRSPMSPDWAKVFMHHTSQQLFWPMIFTQQLSPWE